MRRTNGATEFAVYRQIVQAVDFDEYMSDREIANKVGCNTNSVHGWISTLRRKFPRLLSAFDAIRHVPSAHMNKFGADAVQPIDEIFS